MSATMPFLFFLEMQGFFSGELDLTGRHRPRFLFLLRVWKQFYAEFNKIEPHVKAQLQHYIDDAGQPRSRTTYAIHRRPLWKDFESKWLVPENGYVFVKVRVAAILELISRANSMMKFQRHHLMDLPVELLELIVKNASLEDARIISSTCKRLRTISQRHIFISRRLILNTIDLKDLRLVPAEQRKGATLERYLKEHVRGLSQVNFLLGRPDITQKIKTAQLRVRSVFDDEFWACRQYYGTEVHFESIEYAFTTVLETMQNLTSLSVSRFALNHPLVQAIASLPHLRTLKISTEHFMTPYFSPPQQILSRIENLVLSITPHGLPVLQFLDFWMDSIKNLFIFYPVGFAQDPFSNMCAKERVSLFRLPCAFLDIVIDMLFTSPSSDARCLTHLKLDFREPILDGEVCMLTQALRSYPMEVLVLDGILGGHPSIIEDIATHMPDLLVLTLFLRGGSNQSASTHCVWPKPTWMYAPYFTQFTRLRHFEWNYQYFCDEVITPWSMLLLEGYDDQDGFVQPYLGHESDDYEETRHALYGASVFKAYCRAPELMVVYRLDSAMRCWLVRDDGPIPDGTSNDLDQVIPTLEWNPQMVEDCLEDSCGW
ncbi:hypothetical protein ARMSODRAFT_225625 [Armillaria solidipes]|uniref:F-box domain-containing protein n=1 Tax=Armillaria solidipes TaxID=1076256 RepID=A0A2H3C001_9AGAR|nr:hypothetical protein ARMSODRAFT_225625 [Armillaria solidipes]